jgi:hypothetical protein
MDEPTMKIRTLLSFALVILLVNAGFSPQARAMTADTVIHVKCYTACVTTGTGTTCERICVTSN